MSDDAPTTAPRGVREAIVHAGVVATAWALGLLGTTILFAVTHGYWRSFGLHELLDLLRWAGAVGVAAAVAAHRRMTCTPRRLALECAVIALVAWSAGLALWIGGRVSGGVVGPELELDGTRTISASQALEVYLEIARSPRTLLCVAGLAVALYLAAARRGTRWEGLALSLPYAVFSANLWGFVAVPIVAVALPTLSRAADRAFVRPEADLP